MQDISKIYQSVKYKILGICTQLNNLIKPSLLGSLHDSGLNEEKFKEFNFSIENKLKYFASKPGDNSDYYCNYIMLIYGLNKKLFAYPKYSLMDFTREIKPFIDGLPVLQEFKVGVQRGGYLLFKKMERPHELKSK